MIGIRKWSDCVSTLIKNMKLRAKNNTANWEILKECRKEIQEYLAVIGWKLVIVEADSYAYLDEITEEDAAEWQHSHPESPVEFYYGIKSLVKKTPYSAGQSVVLMALRQKMQEYREEMTSDMCLITRDEIIDSYMAVMPERNDEAKTQKTVDKYIKDMCDDGYLEEVSGSDTEYIVDAIIERRITVDKLREYAESLKRAVEGEGGGDD